MNNIKSFNEYTGIELEEVVYNQELNEGIMGKGIRGFFNKRASGKVRAELADEIEMSKSIMDGIKQGLETLNDNFDTIKKSIDTTDDRKKGKKQKLLDDLTKILDDSRKNTWDLNELIDDGEIDYTGFTANVGIASVANFGILFAPFRAAVMIHKGYNYFFNIVKNTIRKSLVMLQLNFDQFENLIVTQGFKCAGIITTNDSSNEISEFYGNIYAQMFGENSKANKSISKKQLEKMKVLLKGAKDKFDQQMKADKARDNAENLYNNLDPYNNTYTKSLEVLRQYSGDDVQKHLDAIKTSMTKLAGQDVDLQTYAELIMAAAEEHAYAVSTSIYNKFAKMTEVFSLPNQQKLIDLILAANKEQKAEVKKLKKERETEKLEKERIEKEDKCVELFKKIDGVEIGELDGETNKYDESKIKADNWTYEEFNKLEKDDQEILESWLASHREVLKKCDETLQVYVDTPFVNSYYIDSLIDYIGPCLIPVNEDVKESYILNFDEYVNESKRRHKKKFKKKASEEYDLPDDVKEELDKKFDETIKTFDELLKLIFGEDVKDFKTIELTNEIKAKYDYIMSKCEDEGDTKVLGKLKSFREDIETKKKFNIDFDNLDDNQVEDLKELYENKDVAIVALKAIGKKVLKDTTFTKNSKVIVENINRCFEKGKYGVSFMTYVLLANSIKDLKDKRNHDYSMLEQNADDNDTKKSE